MIWVLKFFPHTIHPIQIIRRDKIQYNTIQNKITIAYENNDRRENFRKKLFLCLENCAVRCFQYSLVPASFELALWYILFMSVLFFFNWKALYETTWRNK